MTTACHPHAQPEVSVRVHYVEIPVTDLDRAVSFYESLFDVQLERVEIDGYRMARFPGGDGVGGAYVALAEGDVYVPAKAGPIVYVQVHNIAGVLDRAQSAGAAILLPIRDIGEDGLVAEFEDSEGNRIALNQPR
jgi:uncharacterized protein